MSKHHYLRLYADVPDGQKPPGIHPDWPITDFQVGVGEPAPEGGLLGPLTDEEFEAYLEAERPAFEAANIEHAAEQLVWRDSIYLPGLKESRYEQIDTRTREIIAQGFTFMSKTLSLSSQAQLKLLETYVGRALLTYPIRWSTIDDLDAVDLESSSDVEDMYAGALQAINDALSSGTDLKDQVRDATSSTELDLVVDER